MAVDAKQVIRRVVDILVDVGSIAWKVDELVRWLNDGQRELVILRPDATADIVQIVLVAGVRQQLPATAVKLLDIPNNTDGQMLPIRQIERRELDEVLPGWRASAAAGVIKHFMHDPRLPRAFEVYPPAVAGTKVDAEVSKLPIDVAVPAAGGTWNDVAGAIGVPDIHQSALVDYVLSRAYAKASSFAGNAARAQAHYAAFANSLGADVSASLTVAPQSSNPGEPAARPVA